MTSDVDAVRAVEAAYDAAWKGGDIDALVDLFTEDAVIVSPRGEVASGREEIARLLAPVVGGDPDGSTHTTELERITFVTPDVAVVDGTAVVDGFDGGSVSHRFTDVLVRRDDAWLIAAVRAYSLERM